MTRNFFTFSGLTLFVALCISGIAAWYSVAGLTAIFAGAFLPIIIMGGILEIAKITTTVWLHHYWDKAGIYIRIYLTVAVIVLAFITSMGIFGFLSKAHSDHSLVGSDVQSNIAIYDEKIKTEKENVEANRRALKQMDEGVDQVLGRSADEKGADKAVALRKSQQKERARLQNEISQSQKSIAELSAARAPIAAEVRKVEAEVGPIKYIAALIYGDDPDSNLLERAVRWVIILIVSVFDPLAIVLILAANNSLQWDRNERKKLIVVPNTDDSIDEEIPTVPEPSIAPIVEEEPTVVNFSTKHYSEPTYVMKPNDISTKVIEPEVEKVIEPEVEPEVEIVIEPELEVAPETKEEFIATEGVTRKAELYHPSDEYVNYQGKQTSIAALRGIRPDLVLSDKSPKNEILFSTTFPTAARISDTCIRIDIIPHKVFKFNGSRWILINKTENTTYLQNTEYLQYLISCLDRGEYDTSYLTTPEQDEISDYLKSIV